MMVSPIKKGMQTSGIVYVLLLIAGFAAGPKCDPVTTAAFDACLLNNTARFGAQYFLHGLAALAFLIFVAGLSARLQAAQKSTESLRAVMVSGGTLWALLWLVGVGLAAAASDPGDFERNAVGARSTFILTNALLFGEASGILYLPLALFLGATALAIGQTETLPSWLGTTTAILALLFIMASGLQLVFEAWLVLPMMPLFLIWLAAATAVMLREAA
jgi:hypothetical protein